MPDSVLRLAPAAANLEAANKVALDEEELDGDSDDKRVYKLCSSCRIHESWDSISSLSFSRLLQ